MTPIARALGASLAATAIMIGLGYLASQHLPRILPPMAVKTATVATATMPPPVALHPVVTAADIIAVEARLTGRITSDGVLLDGLRIDVDGLKSDVADIKAAPAKAVAASVKTADAAPPSRRVRAATPGATPPAAVPPAIPAATPPAIPAVPMPRPSDTAPVSPDPEQVRSAAEAMVAYNAQRWRDQLLSRDAR